MPVFLFEGCIKMGEVFKTQVQVNIPGLSFFLLDEIKSFRQTFIFEPSCRRCFKSFCKFPLETGQAPARKKFGLKFSTGAL